MAVRAWRGGCVPGLPAWWLPAPSERERNGTAPHIVRNAPWLRLGPAIEHGTRRGLRVCIRMDIWRVYGLDAQHEPHRAQQVGADSEFREVLRPNKDEWMI